MPSSDGNVINLVPMLNGYMAANTAQPMIPAMAVPFYLLVVDSADVAPGDPPDGLITYHLLDRRGSVSLWRIDDFQGYALYGQLDPSTTAVIVQNNPITFSLNPSFPNQSCAGGPILPPQDYWVNATSAPLDFLAVALPWAPNHMRGAVAEYVVAVGYVGAASDVQGEWDVMLGLLDVDPVAWVVEAIPPVAGHAAPPANDPIYQKGADR